MEEKTFGAGDNIELRNEISESEGSGEILHINSKAELDVGKSQNPELTILTNSLSRSLKGLSWDQ